MSLSHIHTHTLSLSLSHTQTHTHTMSLFHTLILCLSLTHARTHTHTHTHKQTSLLDGGQGGKSDFLFCHFSLSKCEKFRSQGKVERCHQHKMLLSKNKTRPFRTLFLNRWTVFLISLKFKINLYKSQVYRSYKSIKKQQNKLLLTQLKVWKRSKKFKRCLVGR